MADRPILFSAPMVRALLAGTKTQTRRVLKPQPSDFQGAKVPPAGKSWVNKKHDAPFLALHDDLEHWCWWDEYANQGPDWFKVPFAKGQLLWVREQIERAGHNGEAIGYPADMSWLPNSPWEWQRRALSPAQMPKRLSRLTLEVSDVRVERLQDISDHGAQNDCTAEGVFHSGRPVPAYDEWHPSGLGSSERYMFRNLWDSINGKSGFGWDANPFVVAISFTVHRGNIDQLARAS